MLKTPLKASPIAVLAQEVLEISLKASLGVEHGSGNLEVHREETLLKDQPQRWLVTLRVTLETEEGETPPYVGHVVVRGIYEIADTFKEDPARLIRVTGASMLYGVVRETVANFTARSANGMVTLPSVSFYESPPPATVNKRVGKKAPRRRLPSTAKKSSR